MGPEIDMAFKKEALDAEDQRAGHTPRSAAYRPALWLLCDSISSMSPYQLGRNEFPGVLDHKWSLYTVSTPFDSKDQAQLGAPSIQESLKHLGKGRESHCQDQAGQDPGPASPRP